MSKIPSKQSNSVKLSQIKSNPINPREIDDQSFKKLVDSILSFPKMLHLRTIVTDSTYTALGGNMRYKALTIISQMDENEISERLAGNSTFQRKTDSEKEYLINNWLTWQNNPIVPIIIADDLTADEQREFIIKDNVESGKWDYDMLANEWDDTDLLAWGIDVWDTGKINRDSNVNDDGIMPDDNNIDNQEDIKPGDIIVFDSKHRLLCGDTLNISNFCQRCINNMRELFPDIKIEIIKAKSHE